MGKLEDIFGWTSVVIRSVYSTPVKNSNIIYLIRMVSTPPLALTDSVSLKKVCLLDQGNKCFGPILILIPI